MSELTRSEQLSLARLTVTESLGKAVALTKRSDALGKPRDRNEESIAGRRDAEVRSYIGAAREAFARFEELLHA